MVTISKNTSIKMNKIKEILIGTNNTGKYKEISALLPKEVKKYSLKEFKIASPEETGKNFKENSLIKASYFSRKTNLICLADDSGLEVNALGGKPGVVTARFGGPLLNDNQRCDYLLKLLTDVPKEKRQACFRAVLAISIPGGLNFAREGILNGYIAQSFRGENGFGYDPIFELQDGRTLAELGSEKQQISHRFQAMRAIKKVLREFDHG